MGSPILFKQSRLGKNNRLFTIYKFRTMKEAYDKNGNYITDEKRISSLGKFLRNTSIDEIPELINIILGDMSFVGPRPFIKDYLNHYSSEQIQRHNVNPGITGLAQVNGRNSLSWEEKFKYDLFYVKNISFLLDLKILFRTIIKVLCREGINAEGFSTMPKFQNKTRKNQ